MPLVAKKINGKITIKGADYVIAVKKNQPTLYNEITTCIDEALSNNKTAKKIIYFYETHDFNHGREEIRRYYILDKIDMIETAVDWQKLNTIAMVESIKKIDEKIVTNRRYYIASIEKKNAQNFSIAVRTHWAIKNSLHWILDVSFKEDGCRVRKENAAGDFSLLRIIALNYLKNENSTKRGLIGKRKKAGWDINYLEKSIMG